MAAKRRRGSRKRKAPVKNLRWWLFTIAAAVCLLVDVLADQGLIPGWDELGGSDSDARSAPGQGRASTQGCS